MKRFVITLCILISLSFSFPIISLSAQQITFGQGIYKPQDLNLSPNIEYTLQNQSPNEYAFVVIFDANQVAQQLIQLPPLSDEYILTPILPGYVILIVGKGEVVIS